MAEKLLKEKQFVKFTINKISIVFQYYYYYYIEVSSLIMGVFINQKQAFQEFRGGGLFDICFFFLPKVSVKAAIPHCEPKIKIYYFSRGRSVSNSLSPIVNVRVKSQGTTGRNELVNGKLCFYRFPGNLYLAIASMFNYKKHLN